MMFDYKLDGGAEFPHQFFVIKTGLGRIRLLGEAANWCLNTLGPSGRSWKMVPHVVIRTSQGTIPISSDAVCLRDEDDAMLFKLRWT